MSQELVIDSLPYMDGYRKIRIFITEPTKQITADQKFLFMMDAQNLFNDSTSFAGEWQVDESILKMPADKRPIVIGLDHGNSARLQELTPYSHEKYGGGGAQDFLTWIIEIVVPYVETTLDHKLERNHTAIAGSSLGGLFSHYAILSRPDVFSNAGIFSPSFWFSDRIYDFTKTVEISDFINLFLSSGTEESEKMVSEVKMMSSILSRNEMVSHELYIIPEAKHNEKQWRESFPIFLKKMYLQTN